MFADGQSYKGFNPGVCFTNARFLFHEHQPWANFSRFWQIKKYLLSINVYYKNYIENITLFL